MAYRRSIISCALCLVILFWYSVCSSLAFQNGLLRTQVHQTFLGEVGVSEQGGDNKGDRIGEYLATTGLGQGYAWCAAFLSWGFTQHDVNNPQSAWSPDWFPSDKTIYARPDGTKTQKWLPADVIGLWFESKGRIAHVGVIDQVSDDMVKTVEGNTNDYGSREGDRVMRKRRYRRQIHSVSRFIPVKEVVENSRKVNDYIDHVCAIP